MIISYQLSAIRYPLALASIRVAVEAGVALVHVAAHIVVLVVHVVAQVLVAVRAREAPEVAREVMALLTAQRSVRAALDREVVLEARALPIVRVVADLAARREARRSMVGVGRLVVIAEVALDATARDAAVAERRARPRVGVVALLAGRR